MDRLIGISSLTLSLILLWSGRKKTEFTSFVTTLLTVTELAGLAFAVIALGWLGLAVFGAVNVIALLVWSVILASRVEAKLVYAGIQTGNSKESIQALADRIGDLPELASVAPTERAELIRLLAERGRSIPEIEAMAGPIGKLEVIHGGDLTWLVEQFDQILRLAGEPASEAEEAAATIHSTTTNSAATFKEIVDALVTF